MNYSNIQKIINITNETKVIVDDEKGEFHTANPLDEVNKYLAEGWILLAIDAIQNDDHTSHIKQYILGFPKLDSSD